MSGFTCATTCSQPGMIASGYSALEAKNSGIMTSWPMPMKRSRSFTSDGDRHRQARRTRRVPIASRTSAPSTPTTRPAQRRCRRSRPRPAAATACTNARVAAPAALPSTIARARQRRRQQPLELADVALPDHGEAEEDRDEHRRLGHDAGREVGAVVDRRRSATACGGCSAVPKMNSHSSGCTERVRGRAGRGAACATRSAPSRRCRRRAARSGAGRSARRAGRARAQPSRRATRRWARTSL